MIYYSMPPRAEDPYGLVDQVADAFIAMKETYSLVDHVADAFIAMKETIQFGRPSS
jgi:hypothetical protein